MVDRNIITSTRQKMYHKFNNLKTLTFLKTTSLIIATAFSTVAYNSFALPVKGDQGYCYIETSTTKPYLAGISIRKKYGLYVAECSRSSTANSQFEINVDVSKMNSGSAGYVTEGEQINTQWSNPSSMFSSMDSGLAGIEMDGQYGWIKWSKIVDDADSPKEVVAYEIFYEETGQCIKAGKKEMCYTSPTFNEVRTVPAVFYYDLTVGVRGGHGYVRDVIGSASCVDSCNYIGVEQETPYIFFAYPEEGYKFVGWEGNCKALGRQANLILTQNSTCTAVFSPTTSTVASAGGE